MAHALKRRYHNPPRERSRPPGAELVLAEWRTLGGRVYMATPFPVFVPAIAERATSASVRPWLRLWHWLLTPGWFGHTPAAKLRGWARVLDWREAANRADRARLVLRAIKLPARAVRDAYVHVARSGAFLGLQLPCWPETLALATRALDAARRVPMVGWDIAITDKGPVLIEGNLASDPDIAQAPLGRPLSDTVLPDIIDAYMRRLIDE